MSDEVEKQPIEKSVERSAEDRFNGSKQFIYTAISSAAGLGGIWRFPYYAYSNGGGRFLIVYWLSHLFVGLPILCLEFVIGAVFQSNAYGAMKKIHPRFAGVGIAGTWLSLVITTYYQALIAMITVYFFRSFAANLPWDPTEEVIDTCAVHTDAISCGTESVCSWVPVNTDINNMMCGPNRLTAAADFMNTSILHESTVPGAEWPDMIVWWTLIASIIAYVVAYLSLFKGSRATSYVSFISVVGPCFMLLVLVIHGCTLPGSGAGLIDYLGTWDFKSVVDGQMWANAISQNMFGLSICEGIMIGYASHTSRGTNIPLSTIATVVANHLIELIAGVAVFAIAGFLALKSGYLVSALPLSSIKLIFVAYPVGLSSLPNVIRQIFCVGFFFMLFVIGVSSAFSLVHTLAVLFESSKISARFNLTTKKVLFVACLISFIFTTVYCTDTGLLIIDVVDFYVTRYVCIASGFLECAAVGFYFLTGRQEMLVGKKSVRIFRNSYLGGCIVSTLVYFIHKCVNPYGDPAAMGFICFIIAVVIMLPGLIWACAEAVKTGKARGGLSARESISLLIVGNIEELRENLNQSYVGVARDVKAVNINPDDVTPTMIKQYNTERGIFETVEAPKYSNAQPTNSASSQISAFGSRRFVTAAFAAKAVDTLPEWCKSVKFPFSFSVIIKLIGPPMFAFFFCNCVKDFGTYGGYSFGFNFIGIAICIIGFAFIIIGAIKPDAFSWFDQDIDRTEMGFKNVVKMSKAFSNNATTVANEDVQEVYTAIHQMFSPSEAPTTSAEEEDGSTYQGTDKIIE